MCVCVIMQMHCAVCEARASVMYEHNAVQVKQFCFELTTSREAAAEMG